MLNMLSDIDTAVKSHPAWTLGQALGHDMFADGDDSYMVAGQVSTVITVVTIALVAIIGILIYDDVEGAVGTPDNGALADSQDNVTSGFGDAMQLVPVVLLVLVASLVIAVVQRF